MLHYSIGQRWRAVKNTKGASERGSRAGEISAVSGVRLQRFGARESDRPGDEKAASAPCQRLSLTARSKNVRLYGRMHWRGFWNDKCLRAISDVLGFENHAVGGLLALLIRVRGFATRLDKGII